MQDNHRKQDTITSIQAMMQELERILLRAAMNDERGLSGDSKRKVAWMCDDIKRKFGEI